MRVTLGRFIACQPYQPPDEVNCVETVLELPGTEVVFSELFAAQRESGDSAEMASGAVLAPYVPGIS